VSDCCAHGVSINLPYMAHTTCSEGTPTVQRRCESEPGGSLARQSDAFWSKQWPLVSFGHGIIQCILGGEDRIPGCSVERRLFHSRIYAR
jgi:hypothetical protein